MTSWLYALLVLNWYKKILEVKLMDSCDSFGGCIVYGDMEIRNVALSVDFDSLL